MHMPLEGRTSVVVETVLNILPGGPQDPELRVAVLYHGDPDGLAAATFLVHFLKKRLAGHAIETYAVTTDAFDFEKAFAWLEASRPDYVITLDLNFSSRTGALRRLSGSADTVISYDDHVRNLETDPGQSGFYRLRATESPGKPSVPACYFAYQLWRRINADTPSSRALVVAGLIADRAYALVEDDKWFSAKELGAIRALIRLVSAHYSDLAFEPTGDEALTWMLKAVEATVDLTKAVDAPDPFFSTVLTKRAEVDKVVSAHSEALATESSRTTNPTLQVHLYDAGYRVANLVASSARAIRDRRDSQPGILVACQQLKDGTTMAELRLTRGAKRVSLPSLLSQVSDSVALVNFGGHERAAGCRYWQGDHQRFVAALSAAARGAGAAG